MSGEHGRGRGWLLPVIVVAVGAYFLINALRAGTLEAVSLRPVNWVGLGAMLAGLIVAVAKGRNGLWKLAGAIVCGAGAILVFI